MPPPPIANLAEFDLTRDEVTRDEVYAVLQHRFEFMQIDGIHRVDLERRIIVAYRDIRPDEWWCKGHIPGRPVFPGVLMIETAAHMVSYLYHRQCGKEKGFLGFSAVDNVKFRGAVTPPSRLTFIGQPADVRPKRVICDVQGFVGDTMVFEGRITGMPI